MRKLISIIAMVLLTGTNLLAVDYLVTGTLSPDATGTYAETGTYNGKPYYQNGIYFLFWDGLWWNIGYGGSTPPTDNPSAWVDFTFTAGPTPTIGTYSAGSATGDANVQLAPTPTGPFYVTGTISPDATGTFTETGTYDGKSYYQNGAYYLYWTLNNWRIGNALGTSDLWVDYTAGSGDTPTLGDYGAGFGGTGTAVVSDTPPAPPAGASQQLPITLGDGKTLINMVDP